jgi:hypothetical protein
VVVELSALVRYRRFDDFDIGLNSPEAILNLTDIVWNAGHGGLAFGNAFELVFNVFEDCAVVITHNAFHYISCLENHQYQQLWITDHVEVPPRNESQWATALRADG